MKMKIAIALTLLATSLGAWAAAASDCPLPCC